MQRSRIDAVPLLHLDSAHVQKNEIAAHGAATTAHCCFCGSAWFFWMMTHGDFFRAVDVKCLFLREPVWLKSGRAKHESIYLNVYFLFSLWNGGVFKACVDCEARGHQSDNV